MVAGKKLDVFFPARKAIDAPWEVVKGSRNKINEAWVAQSLYYNAFS
jgi:hypothetical protein